MKVTVLFSVFFIAVSYANNQPSKEVIFSDEYFTYTRYTEEEFLVEGGILFSLSTTNVSEIAQRIFSDSVKLFCKSDFKIESIFVQSGGHARRGVSGKGEIPTTFKKTIKCINAGDE